MKDAEKEWVMENLPDVSRLISRVVEILPDVVDAVIDNLPTIINEQLKCQNCEWYKDHRTYGKWIVSEVRCPYCLEYFDIDAYDEGGLDRCPNCGEDMREEGENK